MIKWSAHNLFNYFFWLSRWLVIWGCQRSKRTLGLPRWAKLLLRTLTKSWGRFLSWRLPTISTYRSKYKRLLRLLTSGRRSIRKSRLRMISTLPTTTLYPPRSSFMLTLCIIDSFRFIANFRSWISTVQLRRLLHRRLN